MPVNISVGSLRKPCLQLGAYFTVQMPRPTDFRPDHTDEGHLECIDIKFLGGGEEELKK